QIDTAPIQVWAYNREVNVVGNVLGTPGYHAVYQDSLTGGGLTGNEDHSIYYLGYPGYGEPNPYQGVYYDPVVLSSMLRCGNFDSATDTTRWNVSEIPSGVAVPTDHNLPTSLFLSAAPAWWGNRPWAPLIGPDVSGGQDLGGHVLKIPAQLAYESLPK